MMQFKLCKIGPIVYGDQTVIQFGDDPEEDNELLQKKKCSPEYQIRFLEDFLFSSPIFIENEYFDDGIYQELNAGFTFMNQESRVREFLKALSTAHQCLPEKKDSVYSYHGPSPDEVALVEKAQALGYEFIFGDDTS
jgi:magnesium-transporting ATPase (P-type)